MWGGGRRERESMCEREGEREGEDGGWEKREEGGERGLCVREKENPSDTPY